MPPSLLTLSKVSYFLQISLGLRILDITVPNQRFTVDLTGQGLAFATNVEQEFERSLVYKNEAITTFDRGIIGPECLVEKSVVFLGDVNLNNSTLLNIENRKSIILKYSTLKESRYKFLPSWITIDLFEDSKFTGFSLKVAPSNRLVYKELTGKIQHNRINLNDLILDPPNEIILFAHDLLHDGAFSYEGNPSYSWLWTESDKCTSMALGIPPRDFDTVIVQFCSNPFHKGIENNLILQIDGRSCKPSIDVSQDFSAIARVRFRNSGTDGLVLGIASRLRFIDESDRPLGVCIEKVILQKKKA